MAKLRAGSITKKGNYYYLVYRKKWIALKTRDYLEAEERAVDFLPGLVDPKIEWLEHLAEMGRKAEIELQKQRMATDVTWRSLWDAYTAKHKNLSTNQKTIGAYVSQMNALIKFAENSDIRAPLDLSHALAGEYLSTRSPNAQKRDCRLFKQMFAKVGLDQEVWKDHELDTIVKGRFRRLTHPELVRILEECQTDQERALIRLGLTTGMRLNDCTSICDDLIIDDFIVTIFKKTKIKKNRPTIVPLLIGTRQALNLCKPRYFVDKRDDTWSNTLSRVFARAEIKDNQHGRASFRSLRSTFISIMDEAGIPPHITDAITGHASQGMHGRYSQPSKAALMDAVVRAIPDL